MILLDASLDLGLGSDTGALTGMMTAFTNFIANGGEKIAQAEAGVAGAMLGFQFLRFVVVFGFGGSIGHGVIGFVISAAWFQVATNSVAVAKSFTAWLGSFGAYMSGGTLEGNIMNNPSLFLDLGANAFNKILSHAIEFNFFLAAVAVIVYTVLAFLVEACYMVMAVIVVFVVIQSTLKMIIGIALIPFVIMEELRFIAMKGIGLIMDAGIALAAASVALGVSYGYLMNIKFGDAPNVHDCVKFLVIAVGCGLVSGGAAFVRAGAGVAIEKYQAATK